MIGTVGEPINEEAWNWYNEVVEIQNAQLLMLGGKLKQEGF